MYRVNVLERGPTVIFTKPFRLPKASYDILDENTLIKHIRSLDISWHAKDAMIAQLYYTLHQWFPRHIYEIIYEET